MRRAAGDGGRWGGLRRWLQPGDPPSSYALRRMECAHGYSSPVATVRGLIREHRPRPIFRASHPPADLGSRARIALAGRPSQGEVPVACLSWRAAWEEGTG